LTHPERTVLRLVNGTGAKIEKLSSKVTTCGRCRQWLNESDEAASIGRLIRARD
jgi:cytidine deaminase